ncbi:MAG: DUF5674 family protein [bacterium]
MYLVQDEISLEKLNEIAKSIFGNLVKVVVDIDKEVMVVGGELHADEEALLLQKGSKQQNVWGINIYPEIKDVNWIEFDSMINLRPSQNNFSRGVSNKDIQRKIVEVVNKLVKK